MTSQATDYTGRFAPSPSGPLHLGSLVAALGSWLDARSHGGRWLLRIEDLDRPRNAPGAEHAITEALLAHGLAWDGALVRQQERLELYEQALRRLRDAGRCYPCACSRREIEDAGGVYPGTCRAGPPGGRQPRAWRLRCPDGEFAFVDRAIGHQREDVAGCVGDFVLKRADGIFAYQLAVVVDDAAQAVSDVVRGADLLPSTARQRVLQILLDLPEPRYLHLPLVCLPDGRKLSKQNHAPPLDGRRAGSNLLAALASLGQTLPDGSTPEDNPAPAQVLAWAVEHWQPPVRPVLRAQPPIPPLPRP